YIDQWYEMTSGRHQLMAALSGPLSVISGHMQCKTPCPLYPRKGYVRCKTVCPLWAKSGHLQRKTTCALPLKADIRPSRGRRHIRKRARAFFPSLAASAMLSKKTDEHSTGTALQGQ